MSDKGRVFVAGSHVGKSAVRYTEEGGAKQMSGPIEDNPAFRTLRGDLDNLKHRFDALENRLDALISQLEKKDSPDAA